MHHHVLPHCSGGFDMRGRRCGILCIEAVPCWNGPEAFPRLCTQQQLLLNSSIGIDMLRHNIME